MIETIKNWQGLVAGLLGFLAAIAAILFTMWSEKRAVERSKSALKRAVASEIWGHAGEALEAHRELAKRLRSGKPIRSHEIRNSIRFPPLVIYPNIGSEIGSLEEDAHLVIHFFQAHQVMSNMVELMLTNLDERGIGISNPEDLVEHLLKLAETSVLALKNIGTSKADKRALPNFEKAVEQARSNWDSSKQSP